MNLIWRVRKGKGCWWVQRRLYFPEEWTDIAMCYSFRDAYRIADAIARSVIPDPGYHLTMTGYLLQQIEMAGRIKMVGRIEQAAEAVYSSLPTDPDDEALGRVLEWAELTDEQKQTFRDLVHNALKYFPDFLDRKGF